MVLLHESGILLRALAPTPRPDFFACAPQVRERHLTMVMSLSTAIKVELCRHVSHDSK